MVLDRSLFLRVDMTGFVSSLFPVTLSSSPLPLGQAIVDPPISSRFILAHRASSFLGVNSAWARLQLAEGALSLSERDHGHGGRLAVLAMSTVHENLYTSSMSGETQTLPSWLQVEEPADDPLTAVAGFIADFMNKEHQKDVFEYFMKYGSSEIDPKEIDQVIMTGIRQNGFEVDVVSCSPVDEKCVCLHELIPWLGGGHCTNTEDVTMMLSRMSVDCGLSGDI